MLTIGNDVQDIKSNDSEHDAQYDQRELTPAARRALAEAEERRKIADMAKAEQIKELGGREGPDPVRYGDWENDGITSDF